LDVRSTVVLGQGTWATGKRAELNPTSGTGAGTRKTCFFSANDNRFEAVAGRPQKNVANKEEQGNRCNEETASKPDLPLAAEGRTARPSGEAKQRCALALWFIRVRLTFDMRGMRRWAKPAGACPLDGRVRALGGEGRHSLAATQHNAARRER